MKKLVFALALFVGLTSYGYSYTRTIDEPIQNVSDVANSEVTVSTAPWTQLISSNLYARDGVIINVPATNTGNLYIHLSSTTNTPTVSTNTAIIEIKPTDTERTINVSQDIYLFGVTTHTSEETIYLQQFRQR